MLCVIKVSITFKRVTIVFIWYWFVEYEQTSSKSNVYVFYMVLKTITVNVILILVVKCRQPIRRHKTRNMVDIYPTFKFLHVLTLIILSRLITLVFSSFLSVLNHLVFPLVHDLLATNNIIHNPYFDFYIFQHLKHDVFMFTFLVFKHDSCLVF